MLHDESLHVRARTHRKHKSRQTIVRFEHPAWTPRLAACSFAYLESGKLLHAQLRHMCLRSQAHIVPHIASWCRSMSTFWRGSRRSAAAAGKVKPKVYNSQHRNCIDPRPPRGYAKCRPPPSPIARSGLFVVDATSTGHGCCKADSKAALVAFRAAPGRSNA